MATRVASYVSPTLVFLAFDTDDKADLLGFAIRRSPGFNGQQTSYLPNVLTFAGPVTPPVPSDQAPIQKFWWWDAQINDADRGKSFTYTVVPVTGTVADSKTPKLTLVEREAASVQATLPHNVDKSIGTWFNRAVVSSQSFSEQFGQYIANHDLTGDNLVRALEWLGDGMQQAVPEFIANTPRGDDLSGAIYHLTDEQFIVPAFESFGGDASMVYDAHVDRNTGESPNAAAIKQLTKVSFYPRLKTAIMHDKFIVRVGSDGKATDVTMGSANYTTEGLTQQANVIHTWASPELAQLYLERAELIQDDPAKAVTARYGEWSKPIAVDEGQVSVFFSPEKGRDSVQAIVDAVNAATSSVIFCIFDPTDEGVRDAIFNRGDDGLMMYGLVNHIPAHGSNQPAMTALYDRSQKSEDVYSYGYFSKKVHPNGFWWEYATLNGKAPGPTSVFIHHKFVVIDAETDHPTIFTGSQNISNNSVHNNDENLLQITGCKRVARIYLAEFMRLCDHYKARIMFERSHAGSEALSNSKRSKSRSVHAVAKKTGGDPHDNLTLAPTAKWADKWLDKGSPEYKTRLALTGQQLAIAKEDLVSPNSADNRDDGDVDTIQTTKPRRTTRRTNGKARGVRVLAKR